MLRFRCLPGTSMVRGAGRIPAGQQSGGVIMRGRRNISGLLLAAVFFMFSLCSAGEADSFPFRSVNVGDLLPAMAVRDLAGQQPLDLSHFQGKPLLMVFFGADIPTKRKRSIKALKVVEGLQAFTGEKGIVPLFVDVQGDPAYIVNEVISEAGLSTKVYADSDRQVYTGLGVFVMPSIMLVSAEGRVAAGMGYSNDLAQRLKGEIEIMLAEKTRAQVEEELRPEKVEKSAEEKGAQRHFLLGMTMIERGQPDAAIRELKKAISIEPEMGKAYVYLGCLQLDSGQLATAKESLAKGMESEPDLIDGQICQARIKAGEGDLDGAIDDIGFMMLRNSRNEALHYALAKTLEEKGDLGRAAQEYRKAYELLNNKLSER